MMTHNRQLDTPEGRLLLAALRTATAKLPEVTEVIDGFGHTTFKVRSKSFLIAGMGAEGGDISIRSDPTSQSHLVRPVSAGGVGRARGHARGRGGAGRAGRRSAAGAPVALRR
jgi:hypothetical protein